MIDTVKYYGYFDKTAGCIVKVFPEVNDACAARSSKKFCDDIVKQDKVFAECCETKYLFTIEQATGKVIDNEVKTVFVFRDYIHECDQLKEANV